MKVFFRKKRYAGWSLRFFFFLIGKNWHFFGISGILYGLVFPYASKRILLLNVRLGVPQIWEISLRQHSYGSIFSGSTSIAYSLGIKGGAIPYIRASRLSWTLCRRCPRAQLNKKTQFFRFSNSLWPKPIPIVRQKLALGGVKNTISWPVSVIEICFELVAPSRTQLNCSKSLS